MMRKKLVFFLFLVGITVTSTAQITNNRENEKESKNIYIGIGGGALLNLNSEQLSKSLAPHVNLSVGKWLTPVWGFRAQLAGWTGVLRTPYNRGIFVEGEYINSEIEKTSKNFMSSHFDAVLNLTNAFKGYDPDRRFRLSAFAGPGLTLASSYKGYVIVQEGDTWHREVRSGNLNALINGSLGLMGQYSLNRHFDINLEARATLSPSIFGDYTNYLTDATVAVTAGLTYTFGGKKFTVKPSIDQHAINDEINRYRDELEALRNELESTKQAMENANPVVEKAVEVSVKEVTVAGPHAIFFEIGKAEINESSMVNIRLAAKTIKSWPGRTYKIAGYADQATGSPERNKELSELRAKAVYNALVQEGVDPKQLKIISHGGTENLFGKDNLNRVVILE